MRIQLNWNNVSGKTAAKLVETLGDEKKKSFAKACIEVENGKNYFNKSKARKWLVENCDEKIDWKNRPKRAPIKRVADKIAEWLD